MTMSPEGRRISHLIGGSLLLLVGLLFALQNLGVLHAGRLGDYWPLLLVWVGLTRMLGPGRSRHFASGVVILLLGIVFQLDRLDIHWVSLREAWPFFLIVAGIALLADARRSRRYGAPVLAAAPPQDEGARS